MDLLPRISYCYVAADRAIARQMAARFPHCWFLSNDGVNYHGQAVSGGKKTGAGPLALKRELREISQLEQTKRNEMMAAQASLAALEQIIAALSDELERVRTRQQAQEKDVLALDHEARKLAEDFERSQSRLSDARLQLQKLSTGRITLNESLEHDRAALEQCDELRSLEERGLESAREQLLVMQAELARTVEEHSTLRAGLASLEERQRSLVANVARLESQVRDADDRQTRLAQETEQLTAERSHLLASNSQLESKSAELTTSIENIAGNVNQLAARESDLRARLASADEALKQLRQQAQSAQERRSQLQVSLARTESDSQHLEELCRNELDTSLASLIEGLETVADDTGIQDLEARYAEVRRKIEALGPVNPQALEEYEEAQQRQDFLSAQRQDLLDSIRDTEKLIHQIDDESRKRFTEAFHAINSNFREMFKILFGGGIGEMRLTDEENLAESGIDIVASPPGKKLQSVLLLSGGEKSLTAMALLMAIFQYTPSPFCVLDEVDAPLDEPNIERLTRLLRDMADQTQFIVITHAKRTMEAAQALYGVTMQEPGVSKLVSVKFNEDPGNGQMHLDAAAAVQRDLEAAIA
jgi:chromosome segregation protein